MAWFDPFLDDSAPTATRLADKLEATESQIIGLRDNGNQVQLVAELCKAARCALALGDGTRASRLINEALVIDDSAAVRLMLGQALRLLGQYAQAQVELNQVLSAPDAESLLCAQAELTLAHCALDSGIPDQALEHSTRALPVLHQEKPTHYEALALTLILESNIRTGNLGEVTSAIEALDKRLTDGKLLWLRPMWWALKARLALQQRDFRQAERFARRGLGAADNYGDPQSIPLLYRTLAAALETDHATVDDARDARHRAVTAAESRAARIELARALFELGMHYKLFASLVTLRARGSGYLYDSDRLFREMGLTMPPTNKLTVPLL